MNKKNINSALDNLSTEIIDVQDNDYVVKALTDTFSKLKTTIKDTGLIGDKIYRDRRTRNIITEIDSILLKRFGLRTKHVYSNEVPYAVYTAPPKNHNVLFNNVESHYSEIEKYIKEINIQKENVKGLKYIVSDKRDLTSILYKWKESVDALEGTLNKDGILVDLKNAKILGLPKEYTIFLMSDLHLITRDIDLDPEEMTALLLHEVGHAFTHIEYSIRTIKNTSVILDTLKENLDKDKTYKKSLLICYEKLGGKPHEIEDKNTTKVFLTLMDRYVKASNSIDENTHANTDSEQLADQFAVRFGIGVQLSTAIEKVQKKLKDFNFKMSAENSMTVLLLGGFWSIAFTGSILGAISFFGIITVGVMMMVYFMDTLYSIATHGNQAEGQTYDYDKRRYIRIKNDLIRQLRKSKLPKDVIKQKLNDIKHIEVMIENAEPEEDQIPLIDKIVRVMSPAGKELADNKKLDELVEDLMENDLYIASNKLKTI